MARYLLLPISAIALVLTATAAGSGSPDDPGAPIRGDRYRPVISGTKNFRPVEPLPWGDINQRVAPRETSGKNRAMPQRKGAAPIHKH